MTKYKIHLHGQEIEIASTRQGSVLHVTNNQESAELHLVYRDGSTFVLERQLPNGTHRRYRVAGHMAGDKRQVWVNGRTFSYERVRQRGSGRSGDGSLASAIPAIVSQLLVKVGDKVSAGDKLILLESMKMVIPIQAPHDGLVTAVHCTAGESVPAGIPLLTLELEKTSQA